MKTTIQAAIDIGTYAVLGILVSKNMSTGEVEVLAKTKQSCFGVRNGEVTRPRDVATAVSQVKQNLEQTSGLTIKEAMVNVSGKHLFSMSSQGLVSVSRADQKISHEDVDRVLTAAKAINLPPNKDIIDLHTKEFIIDGEGGIKEPAGLCGMRLEAKVLLVCMFTPIIDSVYKTFEAAGVGVAGILPSPLASARAVLSPQQKEVGCAVIDIGAGTTSLSVFEKGCLVNFVVFPAGSANITNDIAIGLRTEIATAEKIKKEFGSLMPAMDKEANKGKKERRAVLAKDKIELPEKELVFPKSFLNNIVEARVNQLFGESEKALKKITSIETLPAGIILTGGGANMPGIVDFAKQKFQLPCSLGQVSTMPAIEEPEFSAVCGLALYGLDGENTVAQSNMESNKFGRLKRIFRMFLP